MAAELPLVSIVTPSYNQGQFIERTILSVLRQTYPRIQYIVMDAMSSDDTAAVLDKYCHAISIVVREKDKGQADAINKGLSMSNGAVMAYLNADDCYASATVVQEAIDALRESGADMVYGRRYSVDPNGFFAHSYPYRDFDAALEQKINVIPQECTFWTKDIYERAGGFVNAQFQFAMDYELWLRFLANGAQFRSIDKVFGLFRWHFSQKSLVLRNSVAVPEIARLQEKYSGQATHVSEMQAMFESYYFNVNRIQNPAAWRMAEHAWAAQIKMLKDSFADTPLDHWVYKAMPALSIV